MSSRKWVSDYGLLECDPVYICNIFVVYLTTLSLTQDSIALNNWMTVNNDMERMRKETVEVQFKVLCRDAV
jgi:type IV secretory pathway TrbF-like protein